MGPVGRFSAALAAVLALTALAVALATTVVIGRYVEDETERQTSRAVASHFGTIFNEDVFKGPMSREQTDELAPIVAFHFGIYDIVATRFYSADGTVVFSYSPYDIGDRPSDPRIRATIDGATFAERQQILTDGRAVMPTAAYASPAAATAAASPAARYAKSEDGVAAGHDTHTWPAKAMPPKREVYALESWIPISFPDGLRGAVLVWRDMARVDAAVRMMQVATSTIIALAALLLWVILRGVYVRSSKEIRRRSLEAQAALVETERSYDATLHALSNALDVRDSETEGHARRVVQYLELIAEELGVPASERKTLLRGALLHDVGKIGVPDEILRKPGPLTSSEWSAMRRHPAYGSRIVADIPFLECVAEIIRHHHERWDGTGYPDGLRGEEIPIGARMFAVADTFDAMTADRPYRKALDAANARAEIIECGGSQFDPRVVDAFARIPLERLLGIAPAEARIEIAVA
jgi:putative nucleotidyltransferase with HDIG domain